MIFNLHLGVSHSVLCQMEGVGHILKCSGPPPPVLFDHSLMSSRGMSSMTSILSHLMTSSVPNLHNTKISGTR